MVHHEQCRRPTGVALRKGGLEPLETVFAEDAVVFFGSDDPAQAVLLTSTTNTLDNVVEGVTIDLNGTSNEAVEVVVQRNTSAIEDAVNGFVEAFNGVITTMAQFDTFDEATERRGALLGDTTVSNVRRSLYRAIQARPSPRTAWSLRDASRCRSQTTRMCFARRAPLPCSPRLRPDAPSSRSSQRRTGC